ncbi:MAG: hypothetical protein SV201_08620 [Pseudomonadota bacterium]|nr:hypothetical protein [Pseudomonadota bacterium]
MKYSPEQEEQSSADLILQLLRYRSKLISNGQSHNSYEKQFKGLITTLLWSHTEAYGKYKGCRYWSKGALESLDKHNGKVVTNKTIDPTHALRHEHLFPRKDTIDLLFELDSPTIDAVSNILELNIGVVVTVEEDSRLSKKGNREDVWKRYRDANILVEQKGDGGIKN